METEETGRSRFSYFGDEPTEGGVHKVGEREKQRTQATPGRYSTPGVPGPEEKLLDISELVRHVGMRYTHHFALPPSKTPDFETTQPIMGDVTLTNAGGILHLQGKARTTIRMECSRCLSPMEVPVTADIQENFDLVTSHNAYQQEEVQAVDEDTPAAVISGNVLDLADLLRQNLILEAPWQPICREDCPGIAPGIVTITRQESELGSAADVVPPETQQPFRHLAALWQEKHPEDNVPEQR
jgi:uncharacterized protein